jgi:hypothetical protein
LGKADRSCIIQSEERGSDPLLGTENRRFFLNQGYHFEHNYGHGVQNLSVVFAMLMMLVFLVDQAQQLCCPLFRAVWKKLGSKRSLWEKLRSHFYHFTFRSMRQLYEAMLYDLAKGVPLPTLDTTPLPPVATLATTRSRCGPTRHEVGNLLALIPCASPQPKRTNAHLIVSPHSVRSSLA